MTELLAEPADRGTTIDSTSVPRGHSPVHR
jgi:hypothetical protein